MSRVIEESKSAQFADESVIMKAIKTALTQASTKNQMKLTLYPYDTKGPAELIVNHPYGNPDSTTNFTVSEPVLEADHHKYKVSGFDPRTNKSFSVMRRVRHFYALRECLIYKYPGLYIPPLPRK